ncbi:MAG: hypothetical protein C0622_12695 [Desulfuromonas sp.]|nr:MAG: hypothetical protein C0622_12695 [Desulfuromonas sp.]
MARVIAIIALIFILGAVNGSIWQKEQQLANGRIVYLELAPVDPRSLMQGDYMALRFAIGNSISSALREQLNSLIQPDKVSDGYVIVKLDDSRVAGFQRLDTGDPLAANEIRLYYRVRNSKVKFATNAFFFQEGDANLYNDARYGQFRVNDKGEPLLVAMFDKDLSKLGPEQDKD